MATAGNSHLMLLVEAVTSIGAIPGAAEDNIEQPQQPIHPVSQF